jgi:hypothetical protein
MHFDIILSSSLSQVIFSLQVFPTHILYAFLIFLLPPLPLLLLALQTFLVLLLLQVQLLLLATTANFYFVLDTQPCFHSKLIVMNLLDTRYDRLDNGSVNPSQGFYQTQGSTENMHASRASGTRDPSVRAARRLVLRYVTVL